MDETVITVEGRFDHHHPAERGTVRASIGFQGGDRAHVVRGTTELLARLVGQVRQLHHPTGGPVTWWSTDRVRVHSERPWNKDGKQLPLVHHASVLLEVKFSDLGRLAEWVEEVAVLDGVTVGGVEWALTEVTRARLTTESRDRAVRDAVAKATAYATSLGLGAVRPLALAEPGMLGDRTAPTAPDTAAPMLRGAAVAAGSPGLDLRPEDITVSARVHGRFVAS